MIIKETDRTKVLISKDITSLFDKETGFTLTYGKTIEDDPDFCEYGPILADIELTTICTGTRSGGLCPYCYKDNTAIGHNMSFEAFKTLFHKLPTYKGIPVLQQAAFGVDAQCITNPDVWKIFEYTRLMGVIPNVTVADVTDEVAQKLAKVCGAVAVSLHDNENICFDTVKRLTDAGLKQVNIHVMVSKETLKSVYTAIQAYERDPRLAKLNAIVLLSLKKKGRGKFFTPLSDIQFKEIVRYALFRDVPIGFDSCSAPKFAKAVKKDIDKYSQCIESCESTLFSIYIDSRSRVYPCSFSEGCSSWMSGIDMNCVKDFLKEVWFNEGIVEFRKKLIASKDENEQRNCHLYEV